MRQLLGLALCTLAGATLVQPAQAHAVLGVGTTDLPSSAAIHGAWVRQLPPDSAARTAGIQPNDVIVAVDSRALDNAAALAVEIADHRAGDRVTLSVMRPTAKGIERLTLVATLGDAAGGTLPQAEPARNPVSGSSSDDAAPPLGSVQWTKFSDPNEQGFTAEVPSGWNVRGGIVRHVATDPGILLRMVSPDRRTYLMIGDPGISLFTTPAQTMFAQRSPATRPYVPAIDFARNYVTQAIPSLCADPILTGQRERPDLAAGAWTRTNPQAHHDGGEATFTCEMGGIHARGIVAAATYIYQMPGNIGGNLWTVDFLAGVVAPPAGYDSAVEMVKHVLASIAMNPAWMQHQQAATAQAARNIGVSTQQSIEMARAMDRATQQNIAAGDRVIAAQQQRMDASDRQQESFDRAITGYSPYADSNGAIHDMNNVPTNHWINGGGQTATTNGAAPPPGVGWEAMQEVPPQ